MQIFFCTAQSKLVGPGSASGNLLSNDADSIRYGFDLKVKCGPAPKSELSKRIRLDRKRLGLSMPQVADKAEVCVRTIEQYELSWISDDAMDPDILIRIARALEREDYAYLNEYHVWLKEKAYADMASLRERHKGIDTGRVLKAIGTTMATYKSWAKGVGTPTRAAYEFIRKEMEEGL